MVVMYDEISREHEEERRRRNPKLIIRVAECGGWPKQAKMRDFGARARQPYTDQVYVLRDHLEEQLEEEPRVSSAEHTHEIPIAFVEWDTSIGSVLVICYGLRGA